VKPLRIECKGRECPVKLVGEGVVSEVSDRVTDLGPAHVRARSLEHIDGYHFCNDISERESHSRRSGQFAKGKICPSYGPLDPWRNTPDGVDDTQNLRMWLEISRQHPQDQSTKEMVFPVTRIVAKASHCVEWQPSDVITTGIPRTGRIGMESERHLHPGVLGYGNCNRPLVCGAETTSAPATTARSTGHPRTRNEQ